MKIILFILPLAATSAFAQATAATSPAAVSGQPQATSANYTQDSAIAPDASGVSSSANYSNRSGYVGQLYDVTALELIAAPVSVGERASTRIGAGATLDDGTLLVPAASEVSWAVVASTSWS